MNIRRRFDVRGQVQGVGFRPFVHRLAVRHGLRGFVANDTNGAVIEIEGPAAALAAFERDLRAELPPLARIADLRRTDLPVMEQPSGDLPPTGQTGFRIEASRADPAHRPEVTPDAATCSDCLRELFDPADRRHRYPFINCTNCGPRYSIICGVPYDRPLTTMAAFRMCPDCEREYHDPADRRFHAQPNACPVCGPRVWLEMAGGTASADGVLPQQKGGPSTPGPLDPSTPSSSNEAIRATAAMLNSGAILGMKGLGGYHLACRADREDAVRRLRERKLRDGKPLAIMVRDLAAAHRLASLYPADEAALQSTAAPIVLLRKRPDAGIAPSVAPGCRDFGLMLPYTPLHHLLLEEVGAPLVMTSGNLAGEPLTFRDDDARATLADVADALLLHDREIFRPIDDSVVFTFRNDTIPIRRARGYAPRPIRVAWGTSASGRSAPTIRTGETPILPAESPTRTGQRPMLPAGAPRILAVGGELKSTVCLLKGREVYGWEGAFEAILSEHLGDLGNPPAYRHFAEATDRLMELCDFRPDVVACDLHPTYLSTTYARGLAVERNLPVIPVQHHHAHIASVLAEHDEPGPVIGIACDGTGYGTDGAVWGGEILYCAGTRGRVSEPRPAGSDSPEPRPAGSDFSEPRPAGSDPKRPNVQTSKRPNAQAPDSHPPANATPFERLAHLEYFPLLGGDRAAVETWRPAAALVRAAYGPEWRSVWTALLAARANHEAPDPAPLDLLDRQAADPVLLDLLDRQAVATLNAPPTSSLGRVFDAVAFLLGICDRNRHEAEAAMALEALAGEHSDPPEPFSYAVNVGPIAALSGRQSSLDPSAPGPLGPSSPITISFAPTIREIAATVLQHQPAAHLAARFHETVARALTAAAMPLARQRGISTIALSGGCFANRLLLARMVELLEQGGFRPLYNRLVPSGDGGIALGQAFVAAHSTAAV